MGLSPEPSPVHEFRFENCPSKLPSFRGADLAKPGVTGQLDPVQTYSTLHLPKAGSASAQEITLTTATNTTNEKARHIPASHSRHDSTEAWLGPPTSMSLRSPKSAAASTTAWIATQSQLPLNPTTSDDCTSPLDPAHTHPQTQSIPPIPVIPPIRAFRSSRRSTELDVASSSRQPAMDRDSQDETLRALEGLDRLPSQRTSNVEQEEQNSDDSDLFLKLAREEGSPNDPRRGVLRQPQLERQSLPPHSTSSQASISRRRRSDQERAARVRPGEERGTMAQALTYNTSTRDRAAPAAPLDDVNRSRHYVANSRAGPTTPRTLTSREISPESQVSYGGRRPSIPDTTLPSRTNSYRQSNLSYSAPRTYNSSPLVSRIADVHDAPDAPRAAEGTESTVSTTAPSTVWDELEDLKSRIHRLELTGKLPATSGAAMSRASNDRPRTATTTVTTMSSSPKHGRGNSISPTDSAGPPPADAHPLLHSALAKSKALLSVEVYKALESTASDALAIAAMMGSSGQPGLMSSSQSTIGGAGANFVSDRMVRRKADSLCRSLTELCLALSEGRNEQAQVISSQNTAHATNRDVEIDNRVESHKTQRQSVSADLGRVMSSPRALSRLEARRSSLLSTSALPSPRYAPSEASTPTQSSMAGRRTSLLLRSRRAGTEELEEDESRFRAPSRATTELGRPRNSPREYVSQQPLSDNRIPSVQSSLPVRRHYVSTSLTSNGATPLPPVSNLGTNRFLDRSTPDRDTSSVGGRLADERGQRKASLGFLGFKR